MLGVIARCVYQANADEEAVEDKEAEAAFQQAWQALYLERCGLALHRLGWQNEARACVASAPAEAGL
jgi:hypothetical protein